MNQMVPNGKGKAYESVMKPFMKPQSTAQMLSLKAAAQHRGEDSCLLQAKRSCLYRFSLLECFNWKLESVEFWKMNEDERGYTIINEDEKNHR